MGWEVACYWTPFHSHIASRFWWSQRFIYAHTDLYMQNFCTSLVLSEIRVNEKPGNNTVTWKKHFKCIKSPLYFVALLFLSPKCHIRAEKPDWFKNLIKLYWTHTCLDKKKAMAPSSLTPKNTSFEQGFFKHACVCTHTFTHKHMYTFPIEKVNTIFMYKHHHSNPWSKKMNLKRLPGKQLYPI